MISLRGEDWVHKTGLSPPPIIEGSVPSQEYDRSCSCVLSASCLLLFSIRLWNCSDHVEHLCFVFHRYICAVLC